MSASAAMCRELAWRMVDGLEVSLLWNSSDDQLVVVVSDDRSDGAFTVPVQVDERPLDVFYHPFAYASATLVPARHAG
jgi:hypothetical protein